MSMLKLEPAFKDYIWGGTNLIEKYNKVYEGEVLAESWELSCHKDGDSIIANGEHKGKSLRKYIEESGKEVLGENCQRFDDFPILIKFIDAKDNLSIQVHPKNDYALKNEKQYGKTEVWYVTDCKEGAFLYFGFNRDITKEEFEKRIKENTLLEVLNKVEVKKGDVLFIEAGTIHAIGKDIIIAEIQQNSNVTYRVYDYGRVDAQGNGRELHVEKALDVTNLSKQAEPKSVFPHIAKCDYFTVDKVEIKGETFASEAKKESFVSVLIIEGTGYIKLEDTTLEVRKGDSIFIEANTGIYKLEGELEALITTVDKKDNLFELLLTAESDKQMLTVIGEDDKVLSTCEIAQSENAEVLGEQVAKLLEKNKLQVECCAKVEVSESIAKLYENFIVDFKTNIPVPVTVRGNN